MKDKNNNIVHLGDEINFKNDKGIVVCSIDTNEYNKNYPKDEWSYLEKGILIEFNTIGLVHFRDDDKDIEIIYL